MHDIGAGEPGNKEKVNVVWSWAKTFEYSYLHVYRNLEIL